MGHSLGQQGRSSEGQNFLGQQGRSLERQHYLGQLGRSSERQHCLGQQGRSSERQQYPDGAKEKIRSPYTEHRLLFQDKNRVRHSFSQPSIGPKCELMHRASVWKTGHSKSSEIDRMTLPGGDDNELVKNMSNLPGFLLKVEKDNSIQDKALNFGVLDWKRLEKWKYTERMPGKLPKRTSSSGRSFSAASGPPKFVQTLRKQPSSLLSHYPSVTYPTKQPTPHGSRLSSPKRQPFPPHNSLLNSSKKETCSETNAFSSKSKDTQKNLMSVMEVSSLSSKQGKLKKTLLPPNKSAQGNTSEMRFHDMKQTSKCCPAEQQSDELQEPKHFREKRCSDNSQSVEPRTSVDTQVSTPTENRLSDFFSQELYSGEFPIDIPHSCPLPPSAVENDADIFTSENSATCLSSKPKCSSMNEETCRPSSKNPEVAEQPTAKGRTPSPIRRFLGNMGRSFSVKEGSAVPQLSSSYTIVRTVPLRPEITPGPCMDNSEKTQGNAPNRRSSPLRRLLDPLLKQKTAPETARPPSESNPMSKGRKPDASTFQALLQLTLRNGLPFFKLVVENSKEMLAAGVRKLLTSGKNNPCLIYSFYSVHEMRKKSMNWMNQGSKSKNYSLGYNVIGQMMISNSSDRDAKECVLYGADPAQIDKQQNLEFLPSKEIAAIVVKNQLFERRDFVQNSGIVVVLPGGVHGMPTKGAPSPLLSRWRSSGSCDCGGWDVGCKVRVLADSAKNSSIFQDSMLSSVDHVNLYVQGEEPKRKPVFSLKPISSEFYSLELDASVSLLEAFATSVAYITCWKFPGILEMKGEPERSPETGMRLKEQIPARYMTCPPLSPAGRI